jgi:hypothetical protein
MSVAARRVLASVKASMKPMVAFDVLERSQIDWNSIRRIVMMRPYTPCKTNEETCDEVMQRLTTRWKDAVGPNTDVNEDLAYEIELMLKPYKSV